MKSLLILSLLIFGTISNASAVEVCAHVHAVDEQDQYIAFEERGLLIDGKEPMPSCFVDMIYKRIPNQALQYAREALSEKRELCISIAGPYCAYIEQRAFLQYRLK